MLQHLGLCKNDILVKIPTKFNTLKILQLQDDKEIFPFSKDFNILNSNRPMSPPCLIDLLRYYHFRL